MIPALSIIIVAYRSRPEIATCLQSLPRTLDGGAVEIIVVDNSLDEDGTATLVRDHFPHVRCIVPPENLGFGRGNNCGYQISTGASVLFLNPDTVSDENALRHCLQRVSRETTIGLISPKLILPDGTMDLACRRSIPSLWDGFCRATGLAAAFPDRALFAGYNLTHLPADASYDVGAINGAFMLARRPVLDSIAMPAPPAIFDPSFFMYGDDLDLCIRVTRAGYRIVYDGRVCITHVKGVSVARDYDRMSRAIFDANRDVYLKHFNPRSSTLIRWKYLLAFGLWKQFARWRARIRGRRAVRPV